MRIVARLTISASERLMGRFEFTNRILVTPKTDFRGFFLTNQALSLGTMRVMTGQTIGIGEWFMDVFTLIKIIFQVTMAAVTELFRTDRQQIVIAGYMGVVAGLTVAIGYRLVGEFTDILIFGMAAETARPGKNIRTVDYQKNSANQHYPENIHLPSP